MNILPAVLVACLILFIPSAYALGQARYNCTDGYLITNITAKVDGSIKEIYYNNESCPNGCALNGEECNSSQNVDMAAVGLMSFIFLGLSVFFMWLSDKVKAFSGRYYMMKYLYLGVSFAFIFMTVGLLGGIHVFGPNNIADIAMSSFYVLTGTTIFTALVIFFTEVESWYKNMKRLVGDSSA